MYVDTKVGTLAHWHAREAHVTQGQNMQDAEYGQLGGVEVEESRPSRGRWTRRARLAWAVVGVIIITAVALGCVFLLRRRPRPAKTKEEYCAAFTVSSAPYPETWVGTWVDMFSPDDKNPASRRFIDLRGAEAGAPLELEISADTGTERWGRRFFPNTTVNPTLKIMSDPARRTTSFLSKIPEGSTLYPDAQNGALNFTVTNGHVNGKQVLMWNGLYDGVGGPWNNGTAPPSPCDNFWMRSTQTD